MTPSIHTICQAATRKRKATENRVPTEKKAVAKVPKRADADDARKAEGSMTGPRDTDARESAAGEADAERFEASEEVRRKVGVSSLPPPVPTSNPVILLDPSPEQAAKVPSPQAKTAEAGPAHSAVVSTPAAIHSLRETPTRVSPPVGAPGVAEPEAESSQAAPSSAERKEVDPSFHSILSNYSRWAEETLSEASVSELQTHLRRQRRTTLFRETAVAHLWALNSYIAMKDMQVLSDVAVDKAIEEMDYLRTRAERAEMTLEDARATTARALRGEIEANRLRAEKAEEALEVAQRQAANELDNAQVAEEKLEAAELEIQRLKNQLHSATVEIEVARERASTAEEASRRSDVRVAELKVALADAGSKIAEREKKVLEAEGRASNVEERIAKAVEDFRKSDAFDQELADSTAFAYEGGFRDCKEKIRRLYSLEGIEGLEPDEFPEDDGPAPAEP